MLTNTHFGLHLSFHYSFHNLILWLINSFVSSFHNSARHHSPLSFHILSCSKILLNNPAATSTFTLLHLSARFPVCCSLSSQCSPQFLSQPLLLFTVQYFFIPPPNPIICFLQMTHNSLSGCFGCSCPVIWEILLISQLIPEVHTSLLLFQLPLLGLLFYSCLFHIFIINIFFFNLV